MGGVAEQNLADLANETVALQPYLSVALNDTRDLIRKHVPAGILFSLCEQRLSILENEIRKQGFAPFIDLPYLLCHGLCKDVKKSRIAAVLSTFIYLGCDILDDFHDGELPSGQKEYSTAYVSLAGSLFLSTLPTLTLGDFFDASDPKSFKACQAIAQFLQKMAQGQARDIQSRFDPHVSTEEVEAIAIAKSGEGMALFCHLAVLLADPTGRMLTSYSQLGRDLATAFQITSDLTDLFEEEGNDLKQGTVTLPLALHFLRLGNEEKAFFCKLWRQSPQNSEARLLLQEALKESGALAHTALVIESYCEKARETLKTIPLDQKSKEYLGTLTDKTSGYAFLHLQSFLETSVLKTSCDLQLKNTLMGM